MFLVVIQRRTKYEAVVALCLEIVARLSQSRLRKRKYVMSSSDGVISSSKISFLCI